MNEKDKMTVVIQIGNTDDKLTQVEWGNFVSSIKLAINLYAISVHFFGGSPTWERWQNVTWVIECNKSKISNLKKALYEIRESYRQDSVAWMQGKTVFI